jgi:hypothetical protein
MRVAQCSCGQLRVFAEGEPARVSVCHCLCCKLRTGSAFSYNATYPEQQVRVEGEYSEFTRTTDSGNRNTYRFCTRCGSTVAYRVGIRPGTVRFPQVASRIPVIRRRPSRCFRSGETAGAGSSSGRVDPALRYDCVMFMTRYP